MSIRTRLVQGGIWSLVGKSLFLVSTLGWNAVLARLLPQDELGTFYLIASIVLFGETVVLCGLHQSVMRFIASASSKIPIRPVIRGAIYLLILFGTFSIIIYIHVAAPVLSRLFGSHSIIFLSKLTCAWFVLRALQTFLAFLLRGFHKISIAAFIENSLTSTFFAVALLIIWLLFHTANIKEVLYVILFSLLCTVIIAIFLVSDSYKHLDNHHGLEIMIPLQVAVPLGLMSLFAIGINESYTWLAGALTSHSDVALFGASMRLVKLIQMPLLIINGIIPSTIAQLFACGDRFRLEKILRVSATMAFMPALLMSIIALIWPRYILVSIFGSSFIEAAPLLSVLVIGQLINVSVGSPGVLLAMTGHQLHAMIFTIISGLSGITLAYFSSRSYGISGIAYGFVLGLVLQNVLLWLYCVFKLRIRTHPLFWFHMSDFFKVLKH